VNRIFGRSGPVLTDRYHLHVLRTPREVRNALAYVLSNARKHAAQAGRAFSRAFAIDPASSGRWFEGWQDLIREKGPPPPAGRPVAMPRSWLLSVGWKRGGLLSPDASQAADPPCAIFGDRCAVRRRGTSDVSADPPRCFLFSSGKPRSAQPPDRFPVGAAGVTRICSTLEPIPLRPATPRRYERFARGIRLLPPRYAVMCAAYGALRGTVVFKLGAA
jgi:hypothetical protein